ncbi:VOC family protein [Sporohalobacter salinus]|uniref:VOC family protein n=1 Tax=Sporohalobacter salinus TaxID=1494606 RepID=UPI001960A1E6|nr:VOC family protein [Sporohalobacter salinus]MBM7624428.1 lactoylglutathione lyase [Sporohalobacter salinus]
MDLFRKNKLIILCLMMLSLSLMTGCNDIENTNSKATSKSKLTITENITGLQHIGLPVISLNKTITFYKKLGFKVQSKTKITRPEGKLDVAFLKQNDLVLECYQFNDPKLLEKIRNRKNGHIDHIALNVVDIEQAYSSVKDLGFKIKEAKIDSIPAFHDNGVRFFNIKGPNGETIEFNQIQ